jgi:acyl transferase domain-containing protein
VHAKTHCDGYKEEGISFPCWLQQTKLMEQVYEECQINPASVDFVEDHATGTKVSLLILGSYITALNDNLFEELLMAAFF